MPIPALRLRRKASEPRRTWPEGPEGPIPAGVHLARLVLIGLLALTPAPAAAAWGSAPVLLRVRGRPKVVLDQLEFPSDLAQAQQYKAHLKKTLARVTRHVDWGAGRKNRIEYRFFVTELTLTEQDGVLRVRCTAVGKLPRGKTAKSKLSFSGDPNQRSDLVKRVLEIVARGVITRLAELERVRRGELGEAGVRPPPSDTID
jgi:hypothetical protein